MLHSTAETAAPDVGYRADVDGLRAIAVNLVLSFHLNLLPIAGGFIGVDVFFVISGFVIARMITAELQKTGGFSFANFYARRVVRLVPALLLVIGASFIAGWFLLPARDFADLGDSATAASLFYANFFFAARSGYFMAEAITYPLLHLWSLGVEEQFYVVAPIVLVALSQRHWWRYALGAMFALSFALAVLASATETTGAYYQTFYRVFELAAGIALGTGVLKTPSTRLWRTISGVLGLALIVVSALVINEHRWFPGPWALLPCVGTMLVLMAGRADSGSRAGPRAGPSTAPSPGLGWLSHPALVANGRLSYSLYIWHWPILSFAHARVERPLTMLEALFVFALTIAAAVASYACVEKPLRQYAHGLRVVLGSAAATAAAISIAQFVLWTEGVPRRLPQSVAALDKALTEAPGYGMQCGKDSCRLGRASGTPTFLLFGDSHSLAIAPALGAWAADAGLTGISVSRGGCPPLLAADGSNPRGTPKCNEFNAALRREVAATPSLRHIIIVGRWSYYMEDDTRSGEVRHVVLIPGADVKTRRQSVTDALVATVQQFTASGKTVTMAGPVPEFDDDIARKALRAAMRGTTYTASIPHRDFLTRQAATVSMIAAFSSPEWARAGVTVVRPDLLLCRDAATCSGFVDGVPIYRDGNHLNNRGAALLTALFAEMTAPSRQR